LVDVLGLEDFALNLAALGHLRRCVGGVENLAVVALGDGDAADVAVVPARHGDDEGFRAWWAPETAARRQQGQRQRRRERPRERAGHLPVSGLVTLTKNSVPRTPSTVVGVLIFMASGVLATILPDTALSVPRFSVASSASGWSFAPNENRLMSSELSGPR